MTKGKQFLLAVAITAGIGLGSNAYADHHENPVPSQVQVSSVVSSGESPDVDLPEWAGGQAKTQEQTSVALEESHADFAKRISSTPAPQTFIMSNLSNQGDVEVTVRYKGPGEHGIDKAEYNPFGTGSAGFLKEKPRPTCNVDLDKKNLARDLFSELSKVMDPHAHIESHEIGHCVAFGDPLVIKKVTELEETMRNQEYQNSDFSDRLVKELEEHREYLEGSFDVFKKRFSRSLPSLASDEDIKNIQKEMLETINNPSSLYQLTSMTRADGVTRAFHESIADTYSILVEAGKDSGYYNAKGEIADPKRYGDFAMLVHERSSGVIEIRKGITGGIHEGIGVKSHQTVEALESLREGLKPGDNLFTGVMNASMGGMSKILEKMDRAAPDGWPTNSVNGRTINNDVGFGR